MARVVKFPVTPPEKLGPRKVRRKKRKKPDMEELGQLNLFSRVNEARIISLHQSDSFFEEALRLDEMGDPEAEKYYLLAINGKESLEDAYCNLGILKWEQGDHARAIDFLTQCLQKNPRHFEAHYNLANVYSDMGNFKLAKTHYEVAREIEPGYSNTYYNLGLALISLKEYKTAIEAINQYIRLSPGHDNTIANELIRTLKTFG